MKNTNDLFIQNLKPVKELFLKDLGGIPAILRMLSFYINGFKMNIEKERI